MPNCHGYGRASTIDQEDTLDIQEAAIKREWEYRWKDKGYAWAGCHTDQGVSGDMHLRRRPSGLRLCNVIEPGDVVIFTKLDRGFRNVRDMLDTIDWFDERGVAAVFLDCNVDTSTAAGRLFLTILGAFAEFERARTSERMMELWAKRRTEGKPHTKNAPYGFKLAGPRGRRFYVPDPYTREVGRRIVDWRRQGWSHDAIYFHMLEQKYRTRLGKEWSRGAIQRAYEGEVNLQMKEREIAQETGLTPETDVSKVNHQSEVNDEAAEGIQERDPGDGTAPQERPAVPFGGPAAAGDPAAPV